MNYSLFSLVSEVEEGFIAQESLKAVLLKLERAYESPGDLVKNTDSEFLASFQLMLMLLVSGPDLEYEILKGPPLRRS